MTAKSKPKESGGEEPASKPKKVRLRKTTPNGAVPHEPTSSAEPQPATKAPRLPVDTIKALRELESGELTRYDDADDLFKKLGIKIGKA